MIRSVKSINKTCYSLQNFWLKKLKKEERVDFGNEQRYYSCKCSDIYCKCTCPNKYVTANKASSSVLIAILNTLLFVGMNVLEGIVNGEKV